MRLRIWLFLALLVTAIVPVGCSHRAKTDNSEISALPADGAQREKMRQVRQKFLDDFKASSNKTPSSTYWKAKSGGIPVRVTGSLLYDMDHEGCKVGAPGS